MTLSTTTNTVQYDGDDRSVAFAVPYPFLDETTLEVYLILTSDGSSVLQTLSTNYSVTGGHGLTGTVTFVIAPSSPHEVRIVRTEPLTQQTDYVNNDKTDADVQEAVADKLTMITQQLNTKLNRSIRMPDAISDDFNPLLPTDMASHPGASFIVNDAGTGMAMGLPTAASADGRFIQRTMLTTPGDGTFTTTPSTGQMFMRFGAGGGAGAAAAQPSADKVTVGGGGGAGEYVEVLAVLETPGTVYSYHLGAGAALTAPGDSAASGSDTTFTLELGVLTAVGGVGAPDATTNLFSSNAGAGGGSYSVPSDGEGNWHGWTQAGGQGKPGFGLDDGINTYAIGGAGGDSYFGPGAFQAAQTITSQDGAAADSRSAGGAGGAAADTGVAAAGGAGADGIIIIDEYTGGGFNPGT